MDAIGLRLLLSLRICLEAKKDMDGIGSSRSRAVRNCYHESIFLLPSSWMDLACGYSKQKRNSKLY